LVNISTDNQEFIMQPSNPLTPFFRVPKLYVKLPTAGRYYTPDDVDMSINQEVAIYPLTALDQLLLRTPDALLNGESLVKVVKNCAPGVKNPKMLVEPDINVILLGIKIATTGATMELSTPCPSCNHENDYAVELMHLLDTATPTSADDTISYNDTLLIHLKPYNFTQRNLTLLNEISYNNAIKLIQVNSESDDPEKIQQASATVDTMSRRTFSIISQSISGITIQSTGEKITNAQFIEEFLSGITKEQSDIIISKIKELNQSGINADHDFQCASCSHEWKQGIDFDPTSFFG